MVLDRSISEKIESLAAGCSKIAIVSHNNPDGDAAGSTTGLRNFLKSKGIESIVILPNRIPSYLEFLDPEHSIVYFKDEKGKAEKLIAEAGLLFCLDFNNPSRTEGMTGAVNNTKAYKILIDHHLDPQTDAFDFIVSRPEASSTCELLFRIIFSMPSVDGDIRKLDRATADSIATGLITDTNNFSNSITPYTFTAASALLEAGCDFKHLNELIFKRYSESRMRLQGHLLQNVMKVNDRLHSSCMVISEEDKRTFGFNDGDSEGFVNLPLQIGNVTVSALFTETADYIKVSLRSKGTFSVNRLANLYFNGGGHENAAGGKIFGMHISDVCRYFENSVEQFLLNECNKI